MVSKNNENWKRTRSLSQATKIFSSLNDKTSNQDPIRLPTRMMTSTIYRLISTNYIEEKFLQRQVSKLSLSKATIDDDQ